MPYCTVAGSKGQCVVIWKRSNDPMFSQDGGQNITDYNVVLETQQMVSVAEYS